MNIYIVIFIYDLASSINSTDCWFFSIELTWMTFKWRSQVGL